MEARTLIFDLGGVLINYDLARDTEALASVGLPEYSEWANYPALSAITNAYLNGLIEEPEFCQRVRPFCRQGVTDQELVWSMMAVMADLPASRLEALIQLRKTHRLILLSNINQRTWQYALAQFTKAGYCVEDCFDEVFLSYEMKLAKPDTAIFEKVVQITGIVKKHTLFLDDTKANVESAKSIGINSWLVPMNHPEELLKILLSH